MERINRLQNFDLTLSLDTATVIHANKFSRADGAISFFVFSTLYTDVVFRLNEPNKDLPVYIKNLDLPIYSGEDVTLIRAANIIIGYIDTKSNDYYYISNDLGRKLGLGVPYYWIWLTGIGAGVLIYFLQDQTISIWNFVPFVLAWLLVKLQKVILNYRIKKDVDQILRGD
jgi:hypothetical protein